MKIALILFFFLLVHCATAPPSQRSPRKSETKDYDSAPKYRSPRPTYPKPVIVDYDRLQTNLGFRSYMDHIGLKQKRFNTCEAGAGFPSDYNCRYKYLTLLRVQLYCRQSEGTVESVTNIELEPVSNRKVTWRLQGLKGSAETNSRGFLLVRQVTPKPSKNNRILLSIGENILGVRVGQNNKIIVPNNFCTE